MQDLSLIAAALVHHYDPAWLDALEQARNSHSAAVLRWSDYLNKPELLYAFLWMAQESGVVTLLVPSVTKLPTPMLSQPVEEYYQAAKWQIKGGGPAAMKDGVTGTPTDSLRSEE
jgi:hypothetical protein